MEIKALVMDVDGTLTDGKIYVGNSGEMFKCFYVRDGQAIKHTLPRYGVEPIVITGRTSEIVEKRCEDLNIKYLSQGIENKKEKLREILDELNISMDEVAYIGDDINDVECMELVAITACPKNAIDDLANKCDFVSKYDGGEGAVRDFIDWLVSKSDEEKSISFKWNNK